MKRVMLSGLAVSVMVLSGCAVDTAKSVLHPDAAYLAQRAANDLGVDPTKIVVSDIHDSGAGDGVFFTASIGKKQYVCHIPKGFSYALAALSGGGAPAFGSRDCHPKD